VHFYSLCCIQNPCSSFPGKSQSKMATERTPLMSGGLPLTPSPPPPYSDIRRDLVIDQGEGTTNIFDDSFDLQFITCEALVPADSGEKFRRCPECNCLCEVNNSQEKCSTCPNDSCKFIFNVKSSKPKKVSNSFDDPLSRSGYRVECGYCHGTCVKDYLDEEEFIIKCHLCERSSFIGYGQVRDYALICLFLGLATMLFSLALTVATLGFTHSYANSDIYICLVTSIILISRGIWVLFQRHSEFLPINSERK